MNKSHAHNRIGWLDLTRCIAICCVILVHTSEQVYTYELENMLALPAQTKMFAFGLFAFGRLGVPLFLFLTGYLLLDREYGTKECLVFWKRNLFGLLLVTEIWIVIYNFFMPWYQHSALSWKLLIKNMIFVKAIGISHMWYMPVILGIYLFLPLVARTLKNLKVGLIMLPLSIAVLYLFGVPTANVWLNATGHEALTGTLDLNFSGGVYGCMIVFGYLVKIGVFSKIRKNWFVGLGIAAFLGVIWLQLFAYQHGYKYNTWYNNIFLLISAGCLFELLSRVKKIRNRRCVQNCAKCSFGIYLLHNPIVMVLARAFDMSCRPVEIIFIAVVALFASWGIVYFVSERLPKVGFVLFLVRR